MSYRHAVYDYNNVSLTVDLPVTAKMLKDFIFKSIQKYIFYDN